jgi:hypothetical protein
VRRWVPFRYAGGLSLVVLLLLAIAGAIFLPSGAIRAPGSAEADALQADPAYAAVRAWLDGHPGARVVRCGWPPNLTRGGAVAGQPGIWLEPGLALAVPPAPGGAHVIGADGAPHGWVAWDAAGCRVVRPAGVRVQGRVVDARGEALPGREVAGCGAATLADERGEFVLDLGPDALLAAGPEPGPPRCGLAAGGPSTPVRLDAATKIAVVVQAGG